MSAAKDFTAVSSYARQEAARAAGVAPCTPIDGKAIDGKAMDAKVHEEPKVQASPEVFYRAAIAVELLTGLLIAISLVVDAPLEALADPSRTPNPAKAPWYFLGLQELLHYFPPVVAGVLAPTLVVAALIAIPYFDINFDEAGWFTPDRERRRKLFWLTGIALCIFLAAFDVMVALVPTLATMALMAVAAYTPSNSRSKFGRALAAKPLSFWIMSWFVVEVVVLTAAGTFFRGPGWAWVWPWAGAGGLK